MLPLHHPTVPLVGVEPTYPYGRFLLREVRIPFRHKGFYLSQT